MKRFSVWIEGFAATGEAGKAQFIADVDADTFQEACDKLCLNKEFQARWGYYDPRYKTVWGSRLFPTEHQARASFG